MNKSNGLLIFVLLMALFVFSCNSEEDTVSSDDTTDGDSTSDGDFTTDDDDDDSSMALCTPFTYRCDPGHATIVQTCSEAGDWTFYRDCMPTDQVCETGNCVDPADDDDDSTDDDDDDSTGTCSPLGALRCNDNNVEICQASEAGGGLWAIFMDCPSGDVCMDNDCRSPVGDECDQNSGCTEPSQYCLPDIAFEDDGHCATFCDSPGIHCPRGWFCDRGKCEVIDGYCRSTNDCDTDEFCDMPAGSFDGLCNRYCDLPGENCPELYRCITTTTDPNYGKCILSNPECLPCTLDRECDPGYYCEKVTGQTQGCCKPECGTNNPCPGSLNCVDGKCVVGSGAGDCGGACPTGHVCDPTFNQCVLNCPSCGVNECCDANSAPNCYTCQCQNPAICGILLPACCAGYNCSAVVYGVIGYCI